VAVFVGINLKLYFGYARALSWFGRVAEIAAADPAVVGRAVEVFVLPSAPALVDAVRILKPSGIRVGAQNMHWAGRGAYTGEIDPATLVEVGCDLVAVGHAERRRLFGETDHDVARKVAAAVQHGLTPLICVGETHHAPLEQALGNCTSQLDRALSKMESPAARVLIAYEPLWAIGAAAPAESSHIDAVCTALRSHVAQLGLQRASIMYGGAARSGLWSELRGAVDGLFLGRGAHDPNDFARILDEISRPSSASVSLCTNRAEP
jgi:triosephosphate isomerase